MDAVTILGYETRSPAMAGFLREAEAIVSLITDATNKRKPLSRSLLILGETGTGKGWIVNQICRAARLRDVGVIDVGAVPKGLVESELFGHVRGAFTNAKSERPGLFASAKDAIFVDEIGKIAVEVQAKLLRVLETRRVRPVGSDTERDVLAPVIFVAASEDLEAKTTDGTFIPDLWYRVKPMAIRAPALRERMEDFGALVRKLLQGLGRVAGADFDDVVEIWSEYHWPGNIRDLAGAVERCALLWQGLTVETAERWLDEFAAPIATTRSFITRTDCRGIFLRLAARQEGVSIAEAVDRTGMSQPTIWRLARDLTNDGDVRREEINGRDVRFFSGKPIQNNSNYSE